MTYINELRGVIAKATPGPWGNYFMSLDDIDIVEYLEKCVKASPLKRFHWLEGLHPDGARADVAHLGNGPTSGANADFIATFNPQTAAWLLDRIRDLTEELCIKSVVKIEGPTMYLDERTKTILAKLDAGPKIVEGEK